MPARVLVLIALLLPVVSLPREARAEPWFGWRDNKLEDRYAAGDLDEEDVAALRLGRGQVGSSDVAARSWLTLAGFYKERTDGRREYAGIAVLGLALDKIAAGPVHRTREPADPYPSAPVLAQGPSPPPQSPPPPPPRFVVSSATARACVAAAWRASGLGVDDARIEAIVARARLSGLLPEMRLRAMRLSDVIAKVDTGSTDARYYDTTGANLMLEARMTWRLDRLIYADDEPMLERVRLERLDARARVSARVLQALFHWQRALLELQANASDSSPAVEATMRMVEAETTLDVLTNGWFSASRLPAVAAAHAR